MTPIDLLSGNGPSHPTAGQLHLTLFLSFTCIGV